VAHASLTLILREHRALSAMLRSIVLLLDAHRRRDTLPDFAVPCGRYLSPWPSFRSSSTGRRKPSCVPKRRGHDARTNASLGRLDREHAQGEHAIRELEHDLIGFE
jgi:hypothetical protein